MLNLLKLFLSKDPDNTARAYTSNFGGYANCDDNLTFERAIKGQIKCDEGFIWDQKKNCYSVPNMITNASENYSVCKKLHGSKNIKFDSNTEVDSFMDLIKTGRLS